METPVELDVFLVVVGILLWPELTFAILLWWLGHPILGVFAFIVTEFGSVKRVVKKVIIERTVDRSGNQISESKREEREEE